MSKIFSKAKFTSLIVLVFTATLNYSNLALADDPFRSKNPRDIGEHTEEAFETIFFLGDYQGAKEPLKLAEKESTNEP